MFNRAPSKELQQENAELRRQIEQYKNEQARLIAASRNVINHAKKPMIAFPIPISLKSALSSLDHIVNPLKSPGAN